MGRENLNDCLCRNEVQLSFAVSGHFNVTVTVSSSFSDVQISAWIIMEVYEPIRGLKLANFNGSHDAVLLPYQEIGETFVEVTIAARLDNKHQGFRCR